MAKVFPPYALSPDMVPTDQRQGILRELQTLEWLRTTLSDDYIIFHSTHLGWLSNARMRKRAADFLVVNKAGQVLMIEQKTGQLGETAAGLRKAYADGDKNIVTQCHEITDTLRARFKASYGATVWLDIGFLLYCPDYVVRDTAAAGIAPELIIDARQRGALPQVIRRFVPERVSNPDQLGRVRRMLSQDLRFDLDQTAVASEGQRLVTRLTGGLLDFFGGLQLSPYRLHVEGAAGCGKTQMVGWFAERIRSKGQRCLVACFNRRLADQLRETLPSDVQVETLHGIARRMLEAAGSPPDIANGAKDAKFWKQLVSDATDVALQTVPEDWRFDALVIDEGQDIDQAGFELLQFLIPGLGDVVWLEDESQRLYGGQSFIFEGFVRYRCRDNYRTPQRVAIFIQALLPFEFEPQNPLPGDAVQVIDATAETLCERLAERIDRLLADGYQAEQIVVLTGRGIQTSLVIKAEQLGQYRTCKLKSYDRDGTVSFTPGEIRVETIWRFKGQQAAAVLVCELEGTLTNVGFQRLIYVAATRATAHLEFIVPRSAPFTNAMQRSVGQAAG